MTDIQIPSKAVSSGTDVSEPAKALLRGLNLLGTDTELQQAGGLGAIVTGPPQSVALIEAGATAAAKWWAAGLGVSAVAAWGSVIAWWGSQGDSVKVGVIAGAALVTAAIALSIGYLLASDVRGRAAAAVATIEARARLSDTMTRAAQELYEPAPAGVPAAPVVLPLPSQIWVKNTQRSGADEDGWLAVAMERHSDGKHKYIVVKGALEETVAAEKLMFLEPIGQHTAGHVGTGGKKGSP
jgi:hypothetical protein